MEHPARPAGRAYRRRMTSSWDLDERIDLISAMTAEHAQLVNGKVEMTGGAFDAVLVQGFPSDSAFCVVAVMEVPFSHVDEPFVLTLEVLDADGEPVAPMRRAEITASAPDDWREGTPLLSPVVIPMTARFTHAGRHVVRMVLEGDEVRRLGIRVDPLPA